MLFRVFSCVMALLLLTMPCLTLAQLTDDANQAVIDAKNDVNNLHIKEPVLWGSAAFVVATLCGCLGGSVVLGAAHFYTPAPPAEKLIGKSPEYVAAYTLTYQETLQKDNRIAAAGGCLAGSVVAALLWSRFYQDYYY